MDTRPNPMEGSLINLRFILNLGVIDARLMLLRQLTIYPNLTQIAPPNQAGIIGRL